MVMAWVILLGLIAMNALYVAAEFATVAARSTWVKQQAQSGDRFAASLLAIMESPGRLDEYIATCQIGITVSSLVLGAISQSMLGPTWSVWISQIFGVEAAYGESITAILILLLFTFLQILLGELLPKSIALVHSNRLALMMFTPMKVSSTIFRPFIWLLNGSGIALMKVLGIPIATHKHIHSLDEIGLLLADSLDGGLLEPEEHELLHHALSLSEKVATQLMTPRTKMIAIGSDAAFDQLYAMALDTPYTRIIVYGDSIDDIVGCINVRDIFRAKLTNQEVELGSLVKQVPIVPENLTMGKLITLLKSRHSQLAVVMDEHGTTLGVVTVGDLMAELMDDVEIDEFKQPEVFTVIDHDRILMPGSFKLHRAEKVLGALPENDADTVNGLVLEVLGRVPVVGDEVELEETILIVKEVEHHAATKLLLLRKTDSDRVTDDEVEQAESDEEKGQW